MRIGLSAPSIGVGARADVLKEIVSRAEREGFSTVWCGEHVVLVDRSASRYPYAQDGQLAVPPTTDWMDPLIALGFAAAVTTSIRLATGILLLPEHNPVLAAKQTATLDVLSGGRLTLGVGIGWMREEFAALGVPFEGRAERTAEYIGAMRRLWEDDIASFDGEHVHFEAVRCNPKPVRGRRIPVLMGGNGDAALSRVVCDADGWYGFNLGPEEVADRVGVLTELCQTHGRDRGDLEIVVAPFTKPCEPEDLPGLASLGVDEVVLVAEPPESPEDVRGWMTALARHWLAAAV